MFTEAQSCSTNFAKYTDVVHFLGLQFREQGFVISDWEGIDRITSPPHANYSLSIAAGVGAGIDMVISSKRVVFDLEFPLIKSSSLAKYMCR